MSTNSEYEAITFRPPWWLLAFWLCSSGGMLIVGLRFVGPVFHAPVWVRSFSVVVPLLALLEGLILSFAYVRVSREGLASRHHARWCARWEEVEAWTQWGPRGSVYLRTRNGRIRGFSSWCVYRARSDRLAQALERRLGPGAKGDAAIAPWPLKQIV